MKKLARILALALLVAGSYSAAKPQNLMAGLFGYGGPIPVCDPSLPNCHIDPK